MRSSELGASHLEFFGLSLPDLARARDLFQLQLLDHPNVIGTALGRYLIRKTDDWPRSEDDARSLLSQRRTAKKRRTLDNSEIRPYSWPCVVVLVREWIDYGQVERGEQPPDILVPKQLWLPDGRVVPVCVVEAAPIEAARHALDALLFPRSLLGAGYPVVTRAQGEVRVGTLGPVVTNGQRVFALTSRHVLGIAGEPVSTFVQGVEESAGIVAGELLSRLPVSTAYPELAVKTGFVNMDAGLVEIEDVNRWTTAAYGLGPLGDVADAGRSSMSLAFIGRTVVAHGAASGAMRGQIKGLLFRYKAIGGTEYLTDYLIGSGDNGRPLTTAPGDSGALWCLAEDGPAPDGARDGLVPDSRRARPLALQWGGEVFRTAEGASAPYALATSVATVCRMLDLDVIRDWQATQFRYWGAVGHYGIALRAIQVLPAGKLKALFSDNQDNITFPQTDITERNLAGLSKRFVPLADVPDLAWKIGVAQRGPRGHNPEAPNHFADMDQPDATGRTLFDISTDRATALDPAAWLQYFTELGVDRFDQGLLPFRVWQIYDEMVAALGAGRTLHFLCAAGVLAHYIGDACQPLHASMYHDGDPTHLVTREVREHGQTVQRQVPRGRGVHAAYEDDMVNRHVGEIFAGLQSLPRPRARPIASGADAAWETIRLMRAATGTIPPTKLIDAYVAVEDAKPAARADALWAKFGPDTIAVMGKGVATLATLWRAAWKQGSAKASDPPAISTFDQPAITNIIRDRRFLTSYTLDEIGPKLRR